MRSIFILGSLGIVCFQGIKSAGGPYRGQSDGRLWWQRPDGNRNRAWTSAAENSSRPRKQETVRNQDNSWHSRDSLRPDSRYSDENRGYSERPSRRHQNSYRDKERDSQEIRLSSQELSRRANKPRFEKLSDYYAASSEVQSSYKNTSTQLLERTPEYKVETRGGDTFIEFARSGEAQGKLIIHQVRIRKSSNIRLHDSNSNIKGCKKCKYFARQLFLPPEY